MIGSAPPDEDMQTFIRSAYAIGINPLKLIRNRISNHQYELLWVKDDHDHHTSLLSKAEWSIQITKLPKNRTRGTVCCFKKGVVKNLHS